jgi:hypothetical protein
MRMLDERWKQPLPSGEVASYRAGEGALTGRYPPTSPEGRGFSISPDTVIPFGHFAQLPLANMRALGFNVDRI